MNLPNTRLLMYNILALVKVVALIFIVLVGIVLILGEPVHDSMKALIVTKACGALALYVAYRIFQGSLNKLKD